MGASSTVKDPFNIVSSTASHLGLKWELRRCGSSIILINSPSITAEIDPNKRPLRAGAFHLTRPAHRGACYNEGIGQIVRAHTRGYRDHRGRVAMYSEPRPSYIVAIARSARLFLLLKRCDARGTALMATSEAATPGRVPSRFDIMLLDERGRQTKGLWLFARAAALCKTPVV